MVLHVLPISFFPFFFFFAEYRSNLAYFSWGTSKLFLVCGFYKLLILYSYLILWDQIQLYKSFELFQILKDDAVKVLHSIWQQIWETQQWPQDWKRSVFIPIPKKGNAKECSNYCTIALISHASKVMLKILQARLQQHVNCELPDVQAGFRKGRGTRDQIANIHWIIDKAREFQKTSISALLTMPKTLTVWITINCGKFWKRREYQTTWPASWETCMQVRKQQLELDMEQQTGSK